MSSILHRYADLNPAASGPEEAHQDKLEEQKLQSFEEGYQAGWTDAEKNFSAEQKKLGAEFVSTLQDLAFTYQEALVCLNRSLKPLFEEMIGTLIPQTADAVLRAHVVEQISKIAARQAEAHIVLRVAQPDQQKIEELVAEMAQHIQVAVTVDPALTQNQLFIQLETFEREINLSAVCHEITAAMTAFNFHTQKERADV